jgi:CubicO group peptidase (beta-lactamase class C family)
MTKSGLSKARLRRLHDAAKKAVETGEVAGAITLVQRRGETVVDVVGARDRDAKTKLDRRSIFRIASMSKPITAAAAMILVEEGRLSLDEPVDRLLPELADRQVLKDPSGPIDDTVPARRAITLRDLLTFRLGLGIPLGPPETPIQKAMAERLGGDPKASTPLDPDAWMKQIGSLPLAHQPGERWVYHTGSDILGVLIARASGMDFEAFLKARLFEPLGMKDTGFHVPKSKLKRLTTCYWTDPASGQPGVYDAPKSSAWAKPRPFASGGGGLVSTVDDYLAFAEMMLNGGRRGKERILSRLTVEAMTSDQLTEDQKVGAPFLPGFWENRGWGFGVSMITRRTEIAASPGRFGWNGLYSTQWTSDPREEMTCILMTQQHAMPPSLNGLRADFLTLAYQAIDD